MRRNNFAETDITEIEIDNLRPQTLTFVDICVNIRGGKNRLNLRRIKTKINCREVNSQFEFKLCRPQTRIYSRYRTSYTYSRRMKSFSH